VSTSLTDLLLALRNAGAQLSVTDGRLRVEAPAGALTPELQDQVRLHRDAIIAIAGVRPNGSAGPTRSADTTPAPLSHAQERVWLVQALEPESTAYNLVPVIRLDGPLDIARLRAALTRLVERHEPLRTRIVNVDGAPALELAEVPGDLLAVETQASVQEIIAREQTRPFDLERELPFRAVLLPTGAEQHHLVTAFHHIAVDGTALLLFYRDLIELYAGREPAPLPIGYSDYTRWERALWHGERRDSALAYWTGQLEGAPPAIDLPTDSPRPAVQTFTGGLLQCTLDPDATRRLGDLARGEGASLFMVLLAALSAALHQASGERDLVIGAPVDGRTRSELRDLVGMFVNQIALRLQVPKHATFRELLAAARQRTREAFVYQDVPFSLLVDALDTPRDRSRTPVFQVMLNVLPAPLERIGNSAAGVVFSAPDEQQLRDLFDGQAKFDLTLYGREHDGRIHLSLVYNRDLFTETRMQLLLGQVETLLIEGTRNPDRAIDELLAPRTSAPRPEDSARDDKTVVDRILAVCDATPERTALVDQTGEVTWAELRVDAMRIATLIDALCDNDAESGRRAPVGVFVEHGVHAAAAILGVMLTGRAYVPLDPAYPATRLRFMAEDAGIALVLAAPGLVDRAASVLDGCARVIALDATATDALNALTLDDASAAHALAEHTHAAQSTAHRQMHPRGDDVAYLLYTSGSTGQPKAVVQTHANLLRQAERYAHVTGIDSHARVTLTASLSFDASLMDLFGGLLRGATVVFVDLTRSDFATLPNLLHDHGCTTLHTTPTVFRTIANSAPDADFTGIRVVVLGGEAVSTREVEYFDASFPEAARLINLYGSAEHSFSFAYEVPRDLHRHSREIPIGQPVGDVLPVLLDADGQQDPVRGELAIRSSATARGYWNRPELTARAFIPDWASFESRTATTSRSATRSEPDAQSHSTMLYRTGDIVRRRPDGHYVFLHRADRQLKIRGQRVEPREVEAVLASHNAVSEAAVHAVPGADDSLQLAACIAAAKLCQTGDAIIAELQAWCRERLPAFAIPTIWTTVDRLPRTTSGKIDYRQLPTGSTPTHETRVAPRNAEELTLRELWAEVLGVRELDIGVTDDFFALGGHSLSATQVAARIRSVFEIELPLRRLFDHPTIAETAEWIHAHRAHTPALPPVEPADQLDTFPLSYSQERMWFLHELSPTDTAYNMVRGARVVGPFDVDRFFRALDAVAQRQEMLRTVIRTDRGKPHQIVLPAPNHETHFIDLRSLPAAMRLDIARDQFADYVARPFDLAEGPLLRVAVAKLDDQEHLLAVVLHHAAGDQWSFGILTREVALVYERGIEALPPLPVQYRDFAVWQRRFRDGPVLAEQLDYWKAKLHDVHPLDLPTDRPRPTFFSFRGDRVLAPISAEMEAGIHRLARSLKATPFMVLLAVFNVLLHTRTRQQDIAVGVPIANRTQHEIEALIGTFVNTLVHRNDLSGDPTFRQFVEQVRHTALDAYTHQDLPFELLVKELNPTRDTSRAPIFQVLFNLANAPAPARWLNDVTVEPLILRLGVAQFDVTLNVLLHETGSGIQISYNTDLFDRETAQRLLDHYVEILTRAIAQPDARIADIGAPPAQERQLLLEEWNRTEQVWPDDADLPRMIAEQAARTPNRIAVDSPTGSYTYAELLDAAQRVGGALVECGVRPGDRVAIMMQRSRELLAGLIGIHCAGAAYVPIDPTYPEARVRYMLEQSGAAAMLTRDGVARLDVTTNAGVGDNPAYVIFTSGSTGQPKGVEVSHRALANFLRSMAREPGITADDAVLAVTTISFDIAALELFLPLTVGARVVIADEEEVGDGHVLARRIRAEDITLMQATPATWKLLLAAGWSGKRDLRVLCGGEALPLNIAEQLLERVAEVWNMYGPTETTVWSTVQRVVPGEAILIGRPIANTRLYVLDDALQPVPIGVPGELWIGGAGVANGYIGRPDLTAERFVQSPFHPGERIYRTGDLVRSHADGRLEHLGRLDHQVKVRGYRIELGEVEAVLRSHPAVRDATVVVRDDRLVAYIIHDPDGTPGEPNAWRQPAHAPNRAERSQVVVKDLRAWTAGQLPAYMVPAVFVSMEAFPLTANGKVDRNRFPDPAPSPPEHTVAAEPLLASERIIAEVWAELLGLQHVARSDNFFELGGHSLLAMEAVARIEERTGHRLEPRALFFHTLQDLAATLPKPVRA